MRNCLSILIKAVVLGLPFVVGKVPDAEVRVNGVLYRGSYGNFGSRSTYENLTLREPPQDDGLLCLNQTFKSNRYNQKDVLLVPRGNCSFQFKMFKAQSLGALGVIIYNTLESRYGGNKTYVTYPRNKFDYECENGKIQIDDPPFDLDPPTYDGNMIDPYMLMDNPNTLCKFEDDSRTCESRRCILTNQTSKNSYTACCAWDIHVDMSRDDRLKGENTSNSLAIFVTNAQSEKLLSLIGSMLTIRARFYPHFNISLIILWLLATFITALASWYSAKDYRRANFKLTNPQRGIAIEVPNRAPISEISVENNHNSEGAMSPLEQNVDGLTLQDREDSQPSINNSNDNAAGIIEESSLEGGAPPLQVQDPLDPLSIQTQIPIRREADRSPLEMSQPREATAETIFTPSLRRPISELLNIRSNCIHDGIVTLNMLHAVSFIILASIILLLLFYFKFYDIVTVLYGVGCSGCISQLIFRPMYSVLPKWKRLSVDTALCPKVSLFGLSDITLLDIMAGFSGYTVGAFWLTIWFISNHPYSNIFYWIIQNVMGACISIVFLDLLRLNSIKVATVLLVAVFLYDIFFVFISPLIFKGKSIMVTVATGGGAANVSVDYCEKYPNDSSCGEGQPLPMLLNIPRIGDFRSGSSLLGLGDVVLPGLLLSFTARLDEARRLVSEHTNMSVQSTLRGGYTLWLIIAYAFGLLVAYTAVVLMKQAQPALLYIVPTIMCTMIIVGWKEFGELWKGPSIFTWADRLVRYCDSHTFFAHDFATVAESIDEEIDDERGSVRVTELNGAREFT
mmetsp:Transcript_37272/g.42566  ORF Transcript_37272/g.42566 Transcript_37272/m.42566 type:complete len:793 (-) Transcript_37272:239-2617(-)